MEALIYNDTPLADYLEGDAAPYDSEPPLSPTPPTYQYAPTGFPKVQDRLRTLRDTATSVAALHDERFVERFRWTIIASQLLSDDSTARVRPPDDDAALNISLSARGALFAVGLSFFVPWLLAWTRSKLRSPTAVSWTQISFYTALAVCVNCFLLFALRRQYSRFIRQSAVSSAARFVSEAHHFDAATSGALRHIQEIEVVARGYQMSVTSLSWGPNSLTCNSSSPMPPISRSDERLAVRHCRELRRITSESLITGLTQYVHFHNELQPYANVEDLESYYHIYEISSESFAGAVNFANDLSSESQETLKQLRFLISLHVVARKLLLIDLLALRPTSTWAGIQLWRKALRILHTLTEDTLQATRRLLEGLSDEDPTGLPGSGIHQDGDIVLSPVQESNSPPRQHSKMQTRRFEMIANAVRSLNAKVRIAQDSMAELIANDASEAAVSCTIGKHYEHIGSELRSLLVDWERGRSAMSLHLDADTRYSRPSSGGRSPISPSPSLGGVTMVDGGPSDALRLLNGDDDDVQSASSGAFQDSTVDEEVFEAVAKPRKRMSLALSREEKMAKLQEDRRKRATLQEQADTTTNMLRELQMVMKHRPQNRPSTRVTSV